MKRRETVKTTKSHRIRKRVHTTVAPETYEYLKETAVNVGKLLDNVVSEIKKTRATYPNLQNRAGKWARRDSNTRSSPCEGDVITS